MKKSEQFKVENVLEVKIWKEKKKKAEVDFI